MTYHVVDANDIVITLEESASLDFWMFRLKGVAGKTIQIDINSPRKLGKWTTLNPVYADAAMDLSDPALYVAGPSTGETTTAQNVRLPSTDGQKWHFITEANLVGATFTMSQTFQSDSVWIASRVPHPPSYNEKFIRGLAGNPLAKVVDLGQTSENRPLLLVQIGGDDDKAKSKPCLVLAAGEQAEQPDGMWSAQGAIEYLLSDGDAPKKLRDECRFLIIPDLDPDGTASSQERLTYQFAPASNSIEANAWANFFQKWVNDGNRLDAVFELHNVQSKEHPHLSHAYIDDRPQAEAINRAVVKAFHDANLTYSAGVQTSSAMPSRFSGWLSKYYGPLNIVYEINAQDPTRHLDLLQLKATGALLAQSAGDFLAGPDGADTRSTIDFFRSKRLAYWNKSAATQPSMNALDSEFSALDAADPNGIPQNQR
jgi:hypothetical protein